MTDEHDEKAEKIVSSLIFDSETAADTSEATELWRHRIATALRAAAGAREWQPIETAPRDGTSIIVRLGNGEVFRACFVEGLWLAASDIGHVNALYWMPMPPMTLDGAR